MRRKKINKDIYSFDFPYKINKKMFKIGKNNYIRICNGSSLLYQSQVSILGPVGYGPTTLPLRHSDWLICTFLSFIFIHCFFFKCPVKLGLWPVNDFQA